MTASKTYSHKDMNGLKVTNLGAPSSTTDATNKSYVDTEVTGAKSRANHTGSQTASTISDFDTQVRTNRLDQFAAPTGPVSLNSQRISNLATATTGTDAANKQYVDDALAGLVSGQTLKGTVRAYVGSNVNISSPGSTLDGLTPATGDVFLLGGQSTGSQNGPWVWNGAAVAMTRPTMRYLRAQYTNGTTALSAGAWSLNTLFLA